MDKVRFITIIPFLQHYGGKLTLRDCHCHKEKKVAQNFMSFATYPSSRGKFTRKDIILW